MNSRLLRHAVRLLRGLPLAGLLCVAAALVATASEARAQAVYWRGRSGGFDVTWSARDISARRVSDGLLVFSARAVADHEWAEMHGEHDDEVSVREYEVRYRLLSVAGSIISLEEATYCDCGGAHPISWTRFVSYDLARGTVTLPHAIPSTEVVPEAALLRALTADRLVGQAMDSAHVHSFASLRALVQALQTQAIQPSSDDCAYAIGEEFPAGFALHHVENGRVALRFSLGHSYEICRGRMIQVGVLVPPLPRWSGAIAAADARRAGYLMQHAPADRRTVLNYRAR